MPRPPLLATLAGLLACVLAACGGTTAADDAASDGGAAATSDRSDRSARPSASVDASASATSDVPTTGPTEEATSPSPAAGARLDPGVPTSLLLDAACGVAAVRDLDGVDWSTDAPQADRPWVPSSWEPVGEEGLVVEVEVRPGDPPTMTATRNGTTLTYTPTTTPPRCPGT